jgi:2-polyprenyl-3-methyl-5-hydroxy-6-metoxy-1,4-benzoquinol methylase
MDREYALGYKSLYQNHFWWRARETFIIEILKNIVPAEGFGNILDIGCGEGLSFGFLSRFGKPEGIESDPLLTENDGYGYKIYKAQFDSNFMPQKKYGCILMLDSLEHMPNPEQALDHAGELLADKGYLIITVPALMNLWTSHDDINHHFIRYSKKTLKPILIKSSFNIVTMRYFFQWMAPLKLIQRAKERVVHLENKPAQIPMKPINSVAYTLSRFEWFTYGRWFQSFGSSLLAITQFQSNK